MLFPIVFDKFSRQIIVALLCQTLRNGDPGTKYRENLRQKHYLAYRILQEAALAKRPKIIGSDGFHSLCYFLSSSNQLRCWSRITQRCCGYCKLIWYENLTKPVGVHVNLEVYHINSKQMKFLLKFANKLRHDTHPFLFSLENRYCHSKTSQKKTLKQ